MKTAKCHICGCENEIPDGQSSCCALCGADLADAQAETMMREMSKGAYSTADSATPMSSCNIYLTDKRLIVIPENVKMQGFGLSGAAMAAAWNKVSESLTKDLGVVSFPLEKVSSVKSCKFGLFRKAILINSSDGEMVKLAARNLNEWEGAITKAAGNL